jgi:hypothetical protein
MGGRSTCQLAGERGGVAILEQSGSLHCALCAINEYFGRAGGREVRLCCVQVQKEIVEGRKRRVVKKASRYLEALGEEGIQSRS